MPRRAKPKPIDWGLDPDRRREIIAVLLVIIGAIFFLSLLGIGGRFGEAIQSVFDLLWGIVGYLVALAVAAVGIGLLLPEAWHPKPATYLGLLLATLALSGLMELVVDNGGGVFGQAISVGLVTALSLPITLILLFGLLLISLVLIFQFSLKDGLAKIHGAVNGRGEDQTDPRVKVFTTVSTKMGLANRTAGPTFAAVKPLFMRRDPNWNFPGFELLSTSQTKAQAGNIQKNVEVIQKTFKDFGIEVAMGDVHIGPAVTQYTLKPAEGVQLTKLTARQQDLALALAAHPIRLEAPIPGKSAVGVEVPNKAAATVTLREVLESDEYQAAKSKLTLGLGRDVAGSPIVVDLERMPHLLIAGSTGSGKSIAINGIILTLLYRNSPSDLRLILVDPKRVEFTQYNGIPHLLAPVVTEPDKTVNVLKWLVSEMERRFRLFQEVGSRDIFSYNEKMANRKDDESETKLPSIVIIIDELADLMSQSANEVEGAIVRLAQMARATGIHLIVATQRPSVDVITGLIKANISTRIAFAVASQVDSRTIIDQAGAEKLLGKGDMLYLGADFANKPKRIQGVFAAERDIQGVTEFLKKQAAADYNESILEYGTRGSAAGGDGEIDDDLYGDAKQVVIQSGKASASLLQRRLRVGYARAARLLDLLEAQGVIGPADGARPRDILVGFEAGDNSGFDGHRQPR